MLYCSLVTILPFSPLQNEDGVYTGFIKVHLKLRRPVTVPGGGAEAAGKTSFYLPADAVKQLHISSSTTVDEVIQGLLTKFMVLDNPRKFALYRQMHRDGQGGTLPRSLFIYVVKPEFRGSLLFHSSYTLRGMDKCCYLKPPGCRVRSALWVCMCFLRNSQGLSVCGWVPLLGSDLFQKLAISEHPLYLRLIAGPDPECLTFVLKENETVEVEVSTLLLGNFRPVRESCSALQ